MTTITAIGNARDVVGIGSDVDFISGSETKNASRTTY
jgi:hypothetical protein